MFHFHYRYSSASADAYAFARRSSLSQSLHSHFFRKALTVESMDFGGFVGLGKKGLTENVRLMGALGYVWLVQVRRISRSKDTAAANFSLCESQLAIIRSISRACTKLCITIYVYYY